METEEFQGIGVVQVDTKRKEIIFRPAIIEQTRYDDHVDNCMRLLFDVWRSQNNFAKCQYLEDKYDTIESIMLIPRCVPKILEMQSSRDVTSSCEVCGKTFAFITALEKQQFKRHLLQHKYENWRCDCNVQLSCPREVMRHIKLFHNESKRKYVQCSQCVDVFEESKLNKHIQDYHKEFICNVCGKLCPNRNALKVHTQDHKTYTCPHCGQTFMGSTRYRGHKRVCKPNSFM